MAAYNGAHYTIMRSMDPWIPLPLYRHPHPFAEVARRYRMHVQGVRGFFSIIGIPSIALLIAVGVTYFAIGFSSSRVSNSVTDLILSNTPAYDVSWIYVYGLLCLIFFIGFLCFVHPKRIPFTFYAMSLFMIIRSFFVILTHLAPYPVVATPDFNVTMEKIFFGGDFFFSGHTGAPFLMALLYWRDTLLRSTFLAWSLFFAAVVLLGHLHYSIDVFAAFFITYAIYHIALYLFPREGELFVAETPPQKAEIL